MADRNVQSPSSSPLHQANADQLEQSKLLIGRCSRFRFWQIPTTRTHGAHDQSTGPVVSRPQAVNACTNQNRRLKYISCQLTTYDFHRAGHCGGMTNFAQPPLKSNQPLCCLFTGSHLKAAARKSLRCLRGSSACVLSEVVRSPCKLQVAGIEAPVPPSFYTWQQLGLETVEGKPLQAFTCGMLFASWSQSASTPWSYTQPAPEPT